MIYISSKAQTLSVYNKNKLTSEYVISTAKNGLGEQEDSGCTPRGWHEIKDMIGSKAEIGTVFSSRLATGEVWRPSQQAHTRDLILTRILWLSGLEPGRNQGNGVDTYLRYIYIHGTPHESALGQPVSHGCIRMANADIIELFDSVQQGLKVFIE